MTTRRSVLAGLAAAAVLPRAALAQAYPNRPISLLVPWAPGGSTDILARIVALHLHQSMGQPVVIENRTGAAGNIGTGAVARAAPDGYTLLFNTMSVHTMNHALFATMPFDGVKDFSPITLLAYVTNTMVVHPSVPANTVAELIAYAKANPGKLSYGSGGVGVGSHLAMELLLISQKIELVHVPYKGIGPAVTALLGNEVAVVLSTFASALPHVKGGRMRALGVTSRERAPALPEVPTIAESGVPGYEYGTWYGLLAPTGTPRAVVQKLNRAVAEVLASAKTAERFVHQGLTPTPSTPAQFSAHLKADTERWIKVVRDAKIPQQ
jgi:tripartite-type tricarboxylate transporter receptor subunit TctC